MRRVLDLVERVAGSSTPVMISGEVGTGTGLVARAIHSLSPRAHARFVSVNCGALPEELLDTQLFGGASPALLGAPELRAGLFLEANGGTLFLDQIGEMSAALQAKLLRVIERGTVRASGGSEERAVDARILAATHRDLREAARAGGFREDLLYRLDVVSVELPPLRQRREDLPGLLEHFFRSALARHPRSPVRRLAPAAIGRLLKHAWPGNVRELEQTIERLVMLGSSVEISEAELAPALAVESSNESWFGGEVLPMREVQKRYAHWAYQRLGARKMLAAERLGIDFKTLNKLLQAETTG
jgi:two-component system response regulator HydG